MSSWNDIYIGFKGSSKYTELAKQLLQVLGASPMNGYPNEAIGRLNVLFQPELLWKFENKQEAEDLFGIVDACCTHSNSFNRKTKASTFSAIDGLFHLIEQVIPNSTLYLSHEEGNTSDDSYYRYEVIYDPLNPHKIEGHCYYSYGEGINVGTNNPKEKGTIIKEVDILKEPLSSNLLNRISKKASSLGFDELAARILGKIEYTDEEKELIKYIHGNRLDLDGLKQKRKLLIQQIDSITKTNDIVQGHFVGYDWFISHKNPRIHYLLNKLNWIELHVNNGNESYVSECDIIIIANIKNINLNDIKDLRNSISRLEALLEYIKKGGKTYVLHEEELEQLVDDPKMMKKTFYDKMYHAPKELIEKAIQTYKEPCEVSINQKEEKGHFTYHYKLERNIDTSLVECSCLNPGICQHMIALSMILGYQVDNPVNGTIPKVSVDIIPGKEIDRLQEIDSEREKLFAKYYPKVSGGMLDIKELQKLPSGYEKYINTSETVLIPKKHFTLTGAGKYYEAIRRKIAEAGGELHQNVVKADHYLVVCLGTPGHERSEFREEISKAIDLVLENREKKAKTKIVTDYQVFDALKLMGTI